MWDLTFLTGLFSIIVIDIVLGGDNAIVIAMASRKLPEKQRNRAIVFGTAAAIAIRAGLTFIAVYLLTVPLLQFIGGVLLLWIAFKLLVDRKEHVDVEAKGSLAGAIRTIVIADVIMGLDNVVAIAGASHGNYVLVIIGLLISVPVIIWGSKIILKLIERYPFIIYIGSGVLAWTAGSMIINDRLLRVYLANVPLDGIWIPPLLIAVVIFSGFLVNARTSHS